MVYWVLDLTMYHLYDPVCINVTQPLTLNGIKMFLIRTLLPPTQKCKTQTLFVLPTGTILNRCMKRSMNVQFEISK